MQISIATVQKVRYKFHQASPKYCIKIYNLFEPMLDDKETKKFQIIVSFNFQKYK